MIENYLRGFLELKDMLHVRNDPTSEYIAVIVEPRRHELLIPILYNYMYHLPKTGINWNFHVFTHDVEYVLNNLPKGCEITITKLLQNNFTVDDYNRLFRSERFWSLINGENILIFQTDSYIIKPDLLKASYMEYSYIGGIYNLILRPNGDQMVTNFHGNKDDIDLHNSINTNFNINGGLSFRKKSAMIRCIREVSVEDIIRARRARNMSTQYYERSHSICGEDTFFQNALDILGYAIPSFDECHTFCTNLTYDKKYRGNCFGVHGFDKVQFTYHEWFLYPCLSDIIKPPTNVNANANDDADVIVICPWFRTGGPECLHQLCDELKGKMYYVNKPSVTDVDEKRLYPEYDVRVIDELYSAKRIIIPEIYRYSELKGVFPDADVCVYFLSVDNMIGYYRSLDKFDFRCLSQSQYSREFLKDKGCDDILDINDYISFDVLKESDIKAEGREDIVLYNPRKDGLVEQYLLKRGEWQGCVRFVPLSGYDREGLRGIMSKAKIYVDFGYHPGKDKLPREAVAHGLVVITNCKGSAKNDVDIPISSMYKFDDDVKNSSMGMEDLSSELFTLVNDVFERFDFHSPNFKHYRNVVRNEKEVFTAQVRSSGLA